MPTRRAALFALAAGCALTISEAVATDPGPVYEAFFRHVGGLGREHFVLGWPLDSTALNGRDGLLQLEHPRTHRRHQFIDFGAARVRVITDTEYVEIFSDERGCREGWNEFHKRFPEAKGLVQLSHVAFSASGKAAGLLAKEGSGCFGSSVDHYTFLRSGSVWHFGNQENVGRS